MRKTITLCDRCKVEIPDAQMGIRLKIQIQEHHPKDLEFCKDCADEFDFWMGGISTVAQKEN